MAVVVEGETTHALISFRASRGLPYGEQEESERIQCILDFPRPIIVSPNLHFSFLAMLSL